MHAESEYGPVNSECWRGAVQRWALSSFVMLFRFEFATFKFFVVPSA